MSTTYTALQARVSRRVIDLPTAVVAEVPKLINVALAKLQEKHNFRVMESELQAYTALSTRGLKVSVGGASITLPGTYNFKEFRGEPYFVRYGDGMMTPMSLGANRRSNIGLFGETGVVTLDAGAPQLVLEEVGDDLNNRGLSVYPLPDGYSDYPDGEYRVIIPYWRVLPDLVSGTDHNWLTDQASGEEFIVHYAAGEAHGLNWDFEKLAIMQARAETHFKDIVTADKRYRLSAVKEWVPHWRGVNQDRTRL